MGERRFSDEEARLIFGRAAEQENATEATRVSDGSGFTLRELQSIGEEAGLAPESVARAARSVVYGRSGEGKAPRGVPAEVEAERVLPMIVSEDAWSSIVADLDERLAVNGEGTLREVGGARQWRGTERPGVEVTVRLEEVEGGTRLSLQRTPLADHWRVTGDLVAVVAVLAVTMVVAGAWIGLDAVGWTLAALLGVTSAVLVPRHIRTLRRFEGEGRALLAATADRIERIARSDSSGPSGSSRTTT